MRKGWTTVQTRRVVGVSGALQKGVLPPQKLDYLHSSSIINILYEQNITVIPTKFLPPVTQTLALVPM